MPTYEYHCDVCDLDFELFQPITAEPIRKCPICGRRRVRRLIGTGAAVIFKGSGFYQTDYRSDSYRQEARKDTKDKSPAKTDPPDKGKAKGGNTGAAEGSKGSGQAAGGSKD